MPGESRSIRGCIHFQKSRGDRRRKFGKTGLSGYEDADGDFGGGIDRAAESIWTSGGIFGDGVPVYASLLKEGLKSAILFAPSYMNRQRAAVLGALGNRLL